MRSTGVPAGLGGIADPVVPVSGRRESVRGRGEGLAELAGADPARDLHVLGKKRNTSATMKTCPLASAERAIASASSSVSATGFSSKTCFPASKRSLSDLSVQGRREADVDGVDLRVGEHGMTSVVKPAPTVRATFCARSVEREHTVLTRTRSRRPHRRSRAWRP